MFMYKENIDKGLKLRIKWNGSSEEKKRNSVQLCKDKNCPPSE